MSWFEASDELLRAMLVLFGPGLLIGAASGVRRWWLVCAAPAISVGVLSGWAVILEPLGIPWTLASAAGTAILTAALVLVSRRLARRWWGELSLPLGWWPFTVLGLVVAGVLAATAVKAGMTTPDMPPQTWDGIFHLNGVRHIIDTGDASSLHLGTLAAPMKTVSIYPAAWHAVTALTVGDTVVVAANVMAFVIAAMLVPLGSAMLAGALVPASRVLPGLAAVASVAFVAFPSRMISYGTLWPNTLAYALVPVAIALAIVISRGMTAAAAARDVTPDVADDVPVSRPGHQASATVTFALVLVGITAAHPNALLGLGAVLVPLVVVTVVTVMRQAYAHRHWMTFVALGMGTLVVALATTLLFTSQQMRSVIRYARDTYTGPFDAIREVLTDSQLSSTGFGNASMSWTLAVLTVLGLVWTLVHRRNRWLGFSLLVTILLYIAAADPSLPFGVLAGPWYSDAVRLGGLYTLVAIPLVALGMLLVCEALLTVTRAAASRPAQVGVAVAVLAVFLVATGAGRWDLRVERIGGDYAAPESPKDWYGLVTADEVALIERLGDELPEDAVILGNPFSGSALAYAIADVDVVFTHLSGAWSPDALYAGQHFADIESDPEVCEAMNRLGVTHVYLDDLVYWPTHPAQKFYRGIGASIPVEEGFEMVDRSQTARVYAVSRC